MIYLTKRKLDSTEFFRDICVDITYKAVVDVVYIQS